MDLQSANRVPVEHPTIADVEEFLDDVLEGVDEFAILGQSEEHYVQVRPPLLEYRDDTGHYRVAEAEYSPELVRKVFALYLDGGDAYQQAATWEEVADFEQPSATAMGIFIAVAVVVVVAVGAWLSQR